MKENIDRDFDKALAKNWEPDDIAFPIYDGCQYVGGKDSDSSEEDESEMSYREWAEKYYGHNEYELDYVLSILDDDDEDSDDFEDDEASQTSSED